MAGKRYVLVFYDNNNSGLPVCFLPTVTILLVIGDRPMLDTDSAKNGPVMLLRPCLNGPVGGRWVGR